MRTSLSLVCSTGCSDEHGSATRPMSEGDRSADDREPGPGKKRRSHKQWDHEDDDPHRSQSTRQADQPRVRHPPGQHARKKTPRSTPVVKPAMAITLSRRCSGWPRNIAAWPSAIADPATCRDQPWDSAAHSRRCCGRLGSLQQREVEVVHRRGGRGIQRTGKRRHGRGEHGRQRQFPPRPTGRWMTMKRGEHPTSSVRSNSDLRRETAGRNRPARRRSAGRGQTVRRRRIRSGPGPTRRPRSAAGARDTAGPSTGRCRAWRAVRNDARRPARPRACIAGRAEVDEAELAERRANSVSRCAAASWPTVAEPSSRATATMDHRQRHRPRCM